MAGRGPAPKETRRRRNVPARGEWVDLAPLEAPVLQELPEPLFADEVWRPETVAMWESWRQDPVTALWSPADVAFALDTIRLHNEMTASSASELRLRMGALGLTPAGKRDLRWRIAEPQPERQRVPAPVRQLRAV